MVKSTSEQAKMIASLVREELGGNLGIRLNDIRIPRRFMLMGQIINVQMVSHLIHTDDDVGQARYRDNIIALQMTTEIHPFPQSQVEHSFFHELMHFIFEKLNRADLRSDEVLIDQIAGLLHQALSTAEYE